MGKQTIMVCEFYFYSEQSRVSLETARIAYLPKKVPPVFEFTPAEKKNGRKPDSPCNNQETSIESRSSDFNCFIADFVLSSFIRTTASLELTL